MLRIVLCFVLLLGTLPMSAQGFGRRHCGSCYHAPYVAAVQPIIIQERLVPAFVFQSLQAYSASPPPQPLAVLPAIPAPQPQLALAPVALAAAPPQPVCPVPVCDANAEDRIAMKVFKLLKGEEFVSFPNEGLPVLDDGGLTPPPAQLPTPPQPPQGSQPPSPPQPAQPPVSDPAALQRALNNMHTLCASCHSGANRKGDLVLFTLQPDQKIAWNPHRPSGAPLVKGLIASRVDYNQMTPPSMPPSAKSDPTKRLAWDELQAFKEWDKP